jgi:sulfocyanin
MTLRIPLLSAGLLLAAAVGSLRARPLAAQAALKPGVVSDSATRTAIVTLVAGMDGDNAGFNFNGKHNGELLLTVPTGWTVELRFLNKDGAQPHGFDVIPYQTPIPTAPLPPAFPTAQSDKHNEGLGSGKGITVRFAVGAPGRFYIRCPVPGHASIGMYLLMEVSATATAATLAPPATKW